MADSTLAEPVAEERVDNQIVEVILSPQKQAEFQSVSPEVQQNSAPQTTQDLPNVTDEEISTGVLTPDDILTIRRQNPVEALRKLQQLCQLSTEA